MIGSSAQAPGDPSVPRCWGVSQRGEEICLSVTSPGSESGMYDAEPGSYRLIQSTYYHRIASPADTGWPLAKSRLG